MQWNRVFEDKIHKKKLDNRPNSKRKREQKKINDN